MARNKTAQGGISLRRKVTAWLVGGFLEGLLGADTLGLHTLFAIIAMGCCIMKFIKDNGTR